MSKKEFTGKVSLLPQGRFYLRAREEDMNKAFNSSQIISYDFAFADSG